MIMIQYTIGLKHVISALSTTTLWHHNTTVPVFLRQTQPHGWHRLDEPQTNCDYQPKIIEIISTNAKLFAAFGLS